MWPDWAASNIWDSVEPAGDSGTSTLFSAHGVVELEVFFMRVNRPSLLAAGHSVRLSLVAAIILAMLFATTAFMPSAQAAEATSATLSASQQGDLDGTGLISLTFDSVTGEVCYVLTTTGINPVVAAHIHAGEAGTTGGVVVDFGAIVLGTPACVQSTPAQVQAIEASPASFYVNVHTSDFPAGAIRAQLAATSPFLISSTTALAPSGDPAGSGSIDLAFDPLNDQLCYSLTTSGLTTPITVAHIHVGAAGANGGVVVNLDYVPGQVEPKCVPGNGALEVVLADPAGHYVNVHTAGAPAGAIRGQIAAPSTSVSNTTLSLDGLGFGDPDGSGTADFTIDEATGEVCFTLTVADIDAPTAAHIHVGADGQVGGVVVNLDTATNGLSGCVTVAPAVAAAIVADPAGHYVNVHNVIHPAGAIRGQLGPTTTTVVPTPVAPAPVVPLPPVANDNVLAGPGEITNVPPGPSVAGPTADTTPDVATAEPASGPATLAFTGSETDIAKGALILLGLGFASLGATRAARRQD